jgi:hypothetical protein
MKSIKKLTLIAFMLFFYSTSVFSQNKKDKEYDKSGNASRDDEVRAKAAPPAVIPQNKKSTATTPTTTVKTKKPKTNSTESNEEATSPPVKSPKTKTAKILTQNDTSILEDEIKELKKQIEMLTYRVNDLENSQIRKKKN